MDYAANGVLDMAECGRIFRNYRSFCKGYYTKPLAICHAFVPKIMSVIIAIEFVAQFSWDVL